MERYTTNTRDGMMGKMMARAIKLKITKKNGDANISEYINHLIEKDCGVKK